MTIFELRDKFKAIDIRAIAEEIVKEDEVQLLELNKSQLSQGLDSEGKYIEPSYRSGTYAYYKAQKGSQAPYLTPDLKDTGAFYGAFYIDTVKFTIGSKDSKAHDLESKYGENIYGLTGDDLRLYAEISFNKKLKNRILNLL